eukprot:TRINITY_DN1138_c0_g1::TRINITY_DN1138_c0_g1_i1::g.17363::m.17363 TRINITY_DN1138_c0_g1::TRINITY_DN1138_c0_g1_i1::g.17363  ORF type:complete len:105 (-),score=8.46 TRINITY_DN1138_c0_g1_i1:26-340(-)
MHTHFTQIHVIHHSLQAPRFKPLTHITHTHTHTHTPALHKTQQSHTRKCAKQQVIFSGVVNNPFFSVYRSLGSRCAEHWSYTTTTQHAGNKCSDPPPRKLHTHD